MTFVVTMLWALLTLGNHGLTHPVSIQPPVSAPATPHVGHLHAMDGSEGGPA